jgi:hypothetical protein
MSFIAMYPGFVVWAKGRDAGIWRRVKLTPYIQNIQTPRKHMEIF